MALADHLADEEPAEHLDGHQRVQPGLLHGQLAPGAGASTANQIAEAGHHLRQLAGRWWVQLGLGESIEFTKFWLGGWKLETQNTVRIVWSGETTPKATYLEPAQESLRPTSTWFDYGSIEWK